MTCLLTATQRQYDPDILFWLEIVEAPDEPKNKENDDACFNLKKSKSSSRGIKFSKIWEIFFQIFVAFSGYLNFNKPTQIPKLATSESFLAV